MESLARVGRTAQAAVMLTRAMALTFLLACQGPAWAGAPSVAALLANGDTAYRAQRYDQALPWYRAAAEQGDATAEERLGEMYELARGLQVEMAKALVWFRKPADQGDAQAQVDVGLLYANGWGVAHDYSQALAWYRMAADQGDAIAAEFIGVIYENSLGVPADFAQAKPWLDKAIAGGVGDAQTYLCGPYQEAWIRVGFGEDIESMDRLIGKIDVNCADLLTEAKAHRNAVARGRAAAETPRP